MQNEPTVSTTGGPLAKRNDLIMLPGEQNDQDTVFNLLERGTETIKDDHLQRHHHLTERQTKINHSHNK